MTQPTNDPFLDPPHRPLGPPMTGAEPESAEPAAPHTPAEPKRGDHRATKVAVVGAVAVVAAAVGWAVASAGSSTGGVDGGSTGDNERSTPADGTLDPSTPDVEGPGAAPSFGDDQTGPPPPGGTFDGDHQRGPGTFSAPAPDGGSSATAQPSPPADRSDSSSHGS